ncbi:MAG: hypothetical protein ACT4O9_15765 [Blastocatellia bacterium]
MTVELKEQVVETELFADYFQFYLQDDDISKGNLEDAWTKEAVDRLLAADQFVVGIGTVRNMDVPVRITVTKADLDIDFDKYDLVNRCGLEIWTERIVIAGCTDYFPDALRIEVPAGFYDIRIGYGNLDSIRENGLDGDDFYDVLISPTSGPIEVQTLKDARQRNQ